MCLARASSRRGMWRAARRASDVADGKTETNRKIAADVPLSSVKIGDICAHNLPSCLGYCERSCLNEAASIAFYVVRLVWLRSEYS
jgi:hypothetical protein